MLVENDFRAAVRDGFLIRLWGTTRDIGMHRKREQQLFTRWLYRPRPGRAIPDFHDPAVPCPDPAPICSEIHRNEIPTQPLAQDPRIKAFMLADPLSFFATKDSLKLIKAPIQLWGSQYGGDGCCRKVLCLSLRTCQGNLSFIQCLTPVTLLF